jgi:hypothetical protein
MTFANCPKCGSSNVTTAGVCANCGWTRFPQVMGAGESEEAVYELVGEIEIKVTGKALLDDYKRLLFENNSLTVRIAKLEAENERLQDARFTDETICPDGSLRPKVSTLLKRIAKLEAYIDQLIEVGNGMKSFLTPYVDGFRDSYPATSAWESLVKDWKEG